MSYLKNILNKKTLLLVCMFLTTSTFALTNNTAQQNHNNIISNRYADAIYSNNSSDVNAANNTQSSVSTILSMMSNLTADNRSIVEQRLKQEELISENLFGITFYKPTYIMPFYYTSKPYYQVYEGKTPDNQKVDKAEFKAQMSFRFPVWKNIFDTNTSLNVAYTQSMFWQLYAKSQYFRETDYEPELFLMKKIVGNLWGALGAVHQSNGRGGDMERSWNRIYANLLFSRYNFAISFRPWILIFDSVSSDLHNKNIASYLGHGELVASYKIKDVTLSTLLRNNIESGFKRGAVEFDVSFPLHRLVKGYIQVFSGYGQSLIEYNHYTNSAGIGIALSDWI